MAARALTEGGMPEVAEEWSFVAANFAPDPKTAFLERLGFKSEAVRSELLSKIGSPSSSSSNLSAASATGEGGGVSPSAEGSGNASSSSSGAGTPNASSATEDASQIFSSSHQHPGGSSASSSADIFGGGGSNDAGSSLSSWGAVGGSGGGGAFAESGFGDDGSDFGLGNNNSSSSSSASAVARSSTVSRAGEDGNNASSSSSSSSPSSSSSRVVSQTIPSQADNDAVTRALVIGDFPLAVSICLHQERLLDALLLSSAGVGTPDLWSNTLKEVLKRKVASAATGRRDDEVRCAATMSALLNGDLQTLVSASPLQDWRQTLASVVSFSSGVDALGPLAEALGDRLYAQMKSSSNAQDPGHAAALCYIVAGPSAVPKLANLWVIQALEGRAGSVGRRVALQEVSERLLTLRRALATAFPSTIVSASLEEINASCSLILALADESAIAVAAFYAARLPSPPTAADSDVAIATTGMQHTLAYASSPADYCANQSIQALYAQNLPYVVRDVQVAPPPQVASPTPVAAQAAPLETAFYTQAQPAATPAPQATPENSTPEYVLLVLTTVINSWLATQQLNAAESRVLADFSKAVEALRAKYQTARISAEQHARLLVVASSLTGYDFIGAQSVCSELTAQDFQGISRDWLVGLKAGVVLLQAKFSS